MLTFPRFVEEPWQARLAVSLLRLRIPGLVLPASVSAQAQSSFFSVRPRDEAGIIAERPGTGRGHHRRRPTARIGSSYDGPL
jgi:hypothetical protein